MASLKLKDTVSSLLIQVMLADLNVYKYQYVYINLCVLINVWGVNIKFNGDNEVGTLS